MQKCKIISAIKYSYRWWINIGSKDLQAYRMLCTKQKLFSASRSSNNFPISLKFWQQLVQSVIFPDD
jgi:hypothetical protein